MGNDPFAYLALAVTVAVLPGAALLFAVLSVLALRRRLLSAVADQIGELLHSGRVPLAERLRLAAAVIDPRHQAEAQATPGLLPAVEATIQPPAAPKPVVQADPVPVLMSSAAQVTVAPQAQTEGERERLEAALAESGGIGAVARVLGVGASTLRGRLKRYGIEAPTSRRGRMARAATAA
jgi:transcriptional regulator with GAF, ATPase, and Fis domain